MAAALASCYTSPNQSRRHQQGYGCPTAYCIRFLGQMKAVFPSLLGVTSLRLRRHAKGTCDFLIPHLHQWGTSGRYPMPFVKEGRTRPYIQCACSSTLPRKPMIDTSPIPVRRTWRFQKCCTTVWFVFNGRTGMLGTTPSGSVQLQDYYIHPEKMGASRKDLADAIQSYSDNDSQKEVQHIKIGR